MLAFLDHIAIKVKDVEASAAWYVRVLKMKRFQPEEWKPFPVMVLAGESGLALFPQKKGENISIQSLHIAFRIAPKDFDSLRMHLEQEGIELYFEDHVWFQSMYFSDPDGYRLEITTPTKPISA